MFCCLSIVSLSSARGDSSSRSHSRSRGRSSSRSSSRSSKSSNSRSPSGSRSRSRSRSYSRSRSTLDTRVEREAVEVCKSNVIFVVSPSAGREADPGRRAVALAPDPGPTRAHLPRGGTIASLAAPLLRTSCQHLLHLILIDWNRSLYGSNVGLLSGGRKYFSNRRKVRIIIKK